MKKTLSVALFLSVLASFLLLAGCENTVRGFGQDMQHAGKEIQKSTN